VANPAQVDRAQARGAPVKRPGPSLRFERQQGHRTMSTDYDEDEPAQVTNSLRSGDELLGLFGSTPIHMD
jgi:hypothetical protein